MSDAPTRRRSTLFAKPVGQFIEPLTRPVLKAQGLAGSRILTQWSEIVGEKLAAHCIPEKLSFPAGKKVGGTLSISVENGFAPQLQHMQPLMLERMATFFGYKAIERIVINHTYVPKQTKKTVPKKAVISQQTARLADEIEDAELRAALQSFAQALSGN